MSERDTPRALFLRALEIAEDERDEFLLRSCVDDKNRNRVATLLAHHRKTNQFLETPAAAALPPMKGELPFETLGDFRLIREIGRGGMGIVYLAEETQSRQLIALKVLSPWFSRSERSLSRFHHEAKIASRLRHPALVRVARYGSEDGYYYLASELIDGRNLAQDLAMRKRQELARRTYEECAAFLAPLAEGLHYAHQNHVVHRDVKPSNILIDEDDYPHLSDFGLATDLRNEALTHTGELMGTIHYMSPEQALMRRREIDHRSDIFSLGVVLYEMVCGRRPFEGVSSAGVLRSIEHQTPAPMSRDEFTVPPKLEVICRKCLEKDPRHRYQSALRLGDDLRHFVAGEPIAVRAPTRIELLRRGFSRRWRRQWRA